MAGKSGKDGRQDAREQLLDVALALFNEKGSADVTTNQIAAAAGRSPGNLYYHFRDREEIVRHLFERLIARWAEVYAVPDGRAPLPEDIERMLRGNFAALWDFRFIYRDLPTLLQRDDAFRRLYAETRAAGFANLRNLLDYFAAAGLIKAPASAAETEELANLLWLIGDYWLPFIEAGGETVTKHRLDEGIALFRRVLAPFLRIDEK